MKRLFLLIPLFFILSSCSYSQWWVQGGNALWPHGRVSAKQLLVYDTPESYINATALLSDQGPNDITGLFYKNRQTWFPPLRSHLAVDSAHFTGTTHILPALFTSELTMNHGQQDAIVYGSQSWVKNKVSGNFQWGPSGTINALTGEVVLEAVKGNLPYATGVASLFSSEGTSTDTINLGVGFWSDWNRQGSGSTHVNKFYSFHSTLGGSDGIAPVNVVIDTFYHFYGKGDFPSYFGGRLEVSGYLQLFNNTNPSASADMVKFYSTDLSAGNTIPSFYTEGTGVVTANGNIVNRYNGTVYYIPSSTSDITGFLSLSGGTMTGSINMGLTNGIYEIDSIINANDPLNIGTTSADNINIFRNGSNVVSFTITGLVGNSSNGNILDLKWDTDNFEDALLVDASADNVTVAAKFYSMNGAGSSLADAVMYYSTDLTAGNTIPSFQTEGTGVVANVTLTAPNRVVAIRVNGTIYYLQAKLTAD